MLSRAWADGGEIAVTAEGASSAFTSGKSAQQVLSRPRKMDLKNP